MNARVGILLIVASCTFLGGATCTVPPAGNPSAVAAALLVLPDDHALGSADAPITVIEYADFECSFCGRFARETFPTIKKEYVDTGKVRWVFRHFPLRAIHGCAEDAARGSECASDQGRFFDFHDELFAAQTGLCNADLTGHATAIGMDGTTFSGCVAAGEMKAARVQRDLDSGTVAGVPGTPCFFINGRPAAGFLSVAQMRAELDK